MKAGLLLLLLLALGTSGALAADGTTPIAAGAYHACAVSSGQLRCWGDNSAGELGDGTTRRRLSPVTVKGLPTMILEVGASYDRTCALVTGTRVYCWGRGASLSASGKPLSSSLPAKVGGIPKTAHGLSVGVTHACVLDAADSTWCWGLNDRGQIGDGTTKPRPKAMRATTLPASKIVASDGYTCAVLRSGGASCWGRSHGTAGDARNPEGLVVNSRSPVPVAGLEGATDLSATGDFACALLTGGVVSCWGENDHGQLGDGTVAGRSSPVAVQGLPQVAQVVATANHACALDVAGSVFCWGRGDHGQMGDGTYLERHAAGPVAQPRRAAKLFGGASGHWTLALSPDGSAFAWGRGEDGQLGDGGTVDRALPVDVTL